VIDPGEYTILVGKDADEAESAQRRRSFRVE